MDSARVHWGRRGVENDIKKVSKQTFGICHES